MFLRFKSNIPDGRGCDECCRSRSFKYELNCSLKCSFLESAKQKQLSYLLRHREILSALRG